MAAMMSLMALARNGLHTNRYHSESSSAASMHFPPFFFRNPALLSFA